MGRLVIIEEDGSSKEQPPKEAICKSRNKKQGGAVSDESGYYEGDEIRDDSIEIVYDTKRCKTEDSGSNPAVSITPILNQGKELCRLEFSGPSFLSSLHGHQASRSVGQLR